MPNKKWNTLKLLLLYCTECNILLLKSINFFQIYGIKILPVYFKEVLVTGH